MSGIQFRFALALVKILILAACVLLVPRTAAAERTPTMTGESPRIERAVRRLDGVELSPDRVAAIVERLMVAGRVTGIGVAIFNDNAIVYRRSFGMADVDTQRALDENTVMYAASFTKAMFGYLVMQLVEDDVIDLDTSIAEYLPQPLPAYEKYADLAGDERWRRITPRMLLSHTSGLPNFRFFDFDAKVIALNPNGKLRLRRDPGVAYGYSGEGMNLLQFVLEAGLGLDVGALMQTRVFDRFGMTRTSTTWREDFAANLANGHDESGTNLGHKIRQGTRAAGSVDSTLVDMSHFLRGMLRQEGLSPAGFAEMFKPQIRIRSRLQFPVSGDPVPFETETDRDDGIQLSYGLGWGRYDTPHGPAYFKEGGDDGWVNHMIAFPEAGNGLVIMTNSSNSRAIFKALLAELSGNVWTPWQWNNWIPYDAADVKE